MPHFSSVPVLKFSIRTSACSSRRNTTSRPCGFERSRATPRLLRLTPMKYDAASPWKGGPQVRVSSPCGGSTLITSAPWSPSICVQYGPPSTRERSTTLMPASAPVLVVVMFDLSDWKNCWIAGTSSRRFLDPEDIRGEARIDLGKERGDDFAHQGKMLR